MIFRCIYKTKTGMKNNLCYGGLIPHLLLTVSLRSQCAHWLWGANFALPVAEEAK